MRIPLKTQMNIVNIIVTLNMNLFQIYLPSFKIVKCSQAFRLILKEKIVQEKPPDTHRQQLIPNMEHECFCDLLAWGQRYYTDVMYLQMCLIQVMRQNGKFKSDNQQLKNETQQSMSREIKNPKNSSDIIIKKSMKVNITGSELHTS